MGTATECWPAMWKRPPRNGQQILFPPKKDINLQHLILKSELRTVHSYWQDCGSLGTRDERDSRPLDVAPTPARPGDQSGSPFGIKALCIRDLRLIAASVTGGSLNMITIILVSNSKFERGHSCRGTEEVISGTSFRIFFPEMTQELTASFFDWND